jgi:hypothetical protein
MRAGDADVRGRILRNLCAKADKNFNPGHWWSDSEVRPAATDRNFKFAALR